MATALSVYIALVSTLVIPPVSITLQQPDCLNEKTIDMSTEKRSSYFVIQNKLVRFIGFGTIAQ